MIVNINAAAGRYAGRYGQSRIVFEALRHESVRMARSENKGTVITIAKLADSIIVREEADIDRIAERIVKKIKETNDNLPQTAVV